ncbi:MAG: hydroxyproline-2-epimerase [Planctomycetes bacterium]|nr:hydroxyproline-2-epimerase [Planctomycetota bacterium]
MDISTFSNVTTIDSHTGGEPTRVVMTGGPDLGDGPLDKRVEIFRQKYDFFRTAIIQEPRGSDVLVGALLVEPVDKSCVCGVIFFNNVDYLKMCGHGTIGLVVTLAHAGKIGPGVHKIETPVGIVTAELHESGEVSVENVPSYRKAKDVSIDVPGVGSVTGDVAWGGNWFFLTEASSLELTLDNLDQLGDIGRKIRQAVNEQGYPEVDHIELIGPAVNPGAGSRSYVLCPGAAYDRSPCGTGTSAKLACLAADGKLAEGEKWVQESIIGSTFSGTYRTDGDKIIPTITGTAFVNAETKFIFNEKDPYCWGISR